MRWRHLDKSLFVWVLLIGVLLVLVVNPLARLLWASFEHGATGAFTLENYAAAYGRWRYLEALWNSLVLGLAVAVLGTVFGVPMAWAVSRTDMPAKGLVWAAILGTFIVPSYLGAVAWILLAGPNAGWLNRLYVWLTGAASGPLNIYSMAGLVLVIACYSFPYAFVFTRSALDLISSEMEDAASTLGAGTLRTMLRVTLPLTLPAILGAFIVEFLEAIALFGAPALIALPARFQVMTTMLWQFFEFPPKVQVAAAYSMPLLGITVLLFWLQRRIIARKGYVALTGKGGERRLIRLGRWRWVMLGYCLFVTSLSFFLPMLVVLQAAFAKAWGRGVGLDNVTLANLRFVLIDQPITRTATLHTFVYGGTAAALALGLAFAIAYIVHRRLVPLGGALAYIAMAPFVIPGIVLAIGFYAAYTTPPWCSTAPPGSSSSPSRPASCPSPTRTAMPPSAASTRSSRTRYGSSGAGACWPCAASWARCSSAGWPGPSFWSSSRPPASSARRSSSTRPGRRCCRSSCSTRATRGTSSGCPRSG